MKNIPAMVFFFSAILSSAAFAMEKLPPLPAPPERGAVEDLADFRTLFKLQASRTEAECRRAISEVDESLATLFGPPYGPLVHAEVVRLSESFAGFYAAAKPVIKAQKKKWKRARPHLEDSRILPCVEKEKSGAYPSGHATVAELSAEILSRIFPKRDPEIFFARARQISHDRVLGGAHHPSDVRAGQLLGRELFEAWIRDPYFAAELEDLRE